MLIYTRTIIMRKIQWFVFHLALLVLLLSMAGISTGQGQVFVAQLSGNSEVPANASKAHGQAIFQLNQDGTELHYKLIVSNIENVVASHLHLAPEGANGAVVVFLYGPAPAGGGKSNGILAEGTITADNLIGALAGQELSALIEQIETGNVYVNVHTNDGIEPPNTGPGDIASGEVRGQLR
jgi:hypothetical protein